MIRVLTHDDLGACLNLSQPAGWNQTEGDWRRALELQPDGCFAAVQDGVVIGTCTVCAFGPVAWVAMMLVDPAHRSRGIGRALMEHALAFLDALKVRSVRLDATPMGQPLYEKLGFVSQFRLARYAGTLPPDDSPPSPDVMPVSAERWEELAAMDEHVTRTDRRKLLRYLFNKQPGEVRFVEGRGWMTCRQGAVAVQFGPCEGEAGDLLLSDAFRRYAGRHVYIDIPEMNAAARALAEERGLTIQRHLQRMTRGELLVERVSLLWSGAGPEKG